jgi:hypothetical protein
VRDEGGKVGVGREARLTCDRFDDHPGDPCPHALEEPTLLLERFRKENQGPTDIEDCSC